MTISYTALLGLAQPVTGTETGQWGTVVNDEITALLEDAVANAASISVTAGNVTLSTTNGSSNQARMSTLIITGTPGTTRNVVAPSQAKIYVVINQSDGAVVIKGAATSGVTIGAGQTAQVAWNGSDFVEIGNYVHGNFVVNGNLSVNGDSTLGNAGADTTTINGQVIAANSNISKTTTLSASAPALAWIKGATYTDTGTAGGTTQALAPFTVFSTPTLSTSNIVTYTDAATVYIAGAPAAAGSATITNPYSLYVAAGNAYFGASVSATTLDLTNLEVTNIKAKDGTASMTLADSTGVVTFSANPVLNAGTANGVPYLSSPGKVLTTGSALTYDGTSFATTGQIISGGSYNFNTTAGRDILWGTGSYTYITGNPGTGVMAFGIASTELMRLTSTGLGVGTNNPAYKLDVNTGQIRAQESGTGSGDGSLIGATVSANGNAGVLFQTNSVSRWNLTTQGTAGANLRIYNYTLGTTVATFDPSGNLGLGITPSAWAASAIDVAGWASFAQRNTNGWTLVGGNVYWDGSNYKYKNSSTAALYELRGPTGVHAWLTAPSGTAGNAISFTQAMTLDASGNLLVGATSPLYSTANRGNITLNGASTAILGLGIAGVAAGYLYTDANTVQIGAPSSKYISFDINGERARISSDGTFRVKGAGTAGTTDAVQFSGSAPASAMTLDASGNLGIGPTSMGARLDVQGANVVLASDGLARIGSDSSGADTGGQITFRNSDARRAAIAGRQEGGDALAGYLQFGTRGTSGDIAERARITSGGYFKASNNGTYVGSTDPYHELRSTDNNANYVLQVRSAAATSTNSFGIRISYDTTPNTTGAAFLACDDSTANRATIRSNGGLANYQSNNVDLSDIRTKTDISPLSSYWNKIAALEIVTYKYKDQTHNDLNIGVIAQQVEQVAPEFVDADGFGETPEDGVPLKTIYNKDLTFAAIKALQEAMTRIEKLEAEVAALKGA